MYLKHLQCLLCGTPFWWSALTNGLPSTSKATSQPACTLNSLHSEPTGPHLPSTPHWCLFISAQYSTKSFPWNWQTWQYWDSSQTNRHFRLAVTSPPLVSAMEYLRAVHTVHPWLHSLPWKDLCWNWSWHHQHHEMDFNQWLLHIVRNSLAGNNLLPMSTKPKRWLLNW